MRENRPVYKAMTLKELAHKYEVSTKTMLKWLKRCGIVKDKRNGYLFTPKEIERIFDALGEPNNE